MSERDLDGGSSALDRPSVALATAAATIVALVGARVALGSRLGDPVNTVTYLGVVGGFVGAVGMVFVSDVVGFSGPTPAAQVWARTVGDGDPEAAVRPGTFVHLVYGAAAGGLYPRVLWVTYGGGYGSLPEGILTGVAFASGLFVVALAYRFLRLYEMELGLDVLAGYYACHVVYGLWLGLVVGAGSLVLG